MCSCASSWIAVFEWYLGVKSPLHTVKTDHIASKCLHVCLTINAPSLKGMGHLDFGS